MADFTIQRNTQCSNSISESIFEDMPSLRCAAMCRNDDVCDAFSLVATTKGVKCVLYGRPRLCQSVNAKWTSWFKGKLQDNIFNKIHDCVDFVYIFHYCVSDRAYKPKLNMYAHPSARRFHVRDNTRCTDTYYSTLVDTSFKDCAKLCRGDQRCVAFSQHNTGRELNGGCALVDDLASCRTAGQWVTGVKGKRLQHSLSKLIDRVFPDNYQPRVNLIKKFSDFAVIDQTACADHIGVLRDLRLEECVAACRDRPMCVATSQSPDAVYKPVDCFMYASSRHCLLGSSDWISTIRGMSAPTIKHCTVS